MKTNNRNIKVIGISLPAYLLKRVDEKATATFQGRSEYIRNLIICDLRLATVAKIKPKKGQVK